ncbi:hypothetical protein B0H17DRAFT_1207331 [Mycena rosella]|uniref:F-box domain-containing protein n=1 Tax=Mycena rosella TaxID=1033263 RepID=A0AAD7D3E8_MYCRO|nr:hypothetical protein B0H17DRAFT_1207331 [Mycena rosella]
MADPSPLSKALSFLGEFPEVEDTGNTSRALKHVVDAYSSEPGSLLNRVEPSSSYFCLPIAVPLRNMVGDERQKAGVLPVVSPVLRIPNEVTSEIFTQFLPAYPEPPPINGPRSPSFLAGICRQWRDVAVSTPSLWRAIDLDLSETKDHQQLFRLLETWLERCGNCPLSFILMTGEYEGEAAAVPFIEALVRHCCRWQHVKLVLPYENLHLLVKGDMPALRTLGLGSNTKLFNTMSITAPLVVFDHAPNLHTVELYTFFNPFCITLPWSQLTALSGRLYDSELAEILRHSVKLEQCRFTLHTPAHSEPIAVIPPLTRLRALHLTSGDLSPGADDTARLLAALTLPALQTFTPVEPFLGTDTALARRLEQRNTILARRCAA